MKSIAAEMNDCIPATIAAPSPVKNSPTVVSADDIASTISDPNCVKNVPAADHAACIPSHALSAYSRTPSKWV